MVFPLPGQPITIIFVFFDIFKIASPLTIRVDFFKSTLIVYHFESASWIALAAVFPAPIAEMTVAAPVTASPPA